MHNLNHEVNMNRRILMIASVVGIIFAALYIGSPYYAARNLRDAALSGDVDALEQGVDFPVVQNSLKAQMTVALTAEFQNDPKLKNNPFAGLGMMMMPAIIDKAVGSYVTPEGVGALYRGRKPGQPEAAQSNPEIEYSTEYSSLDRFRVHTMGHSSSENGPTFLFERRGLFSWKLIKIELPEGFLKRDDNLKN